MGSESRTAFNSRFPVLKKVDTTSLQEFASLLGPIELRSFDQVYGNIRRLLQIEVQESALAALCWFYDSEVRCFLFKNFQMAPTLEEYEKILGFDRADVKPYQYQGNYYSDDKFASFLQISVEELQSHKVVRNKIAGFPQEYFESLLTSYVGSDDWVSFKRVLALTIFGVILFPQIEKHIDETAIGVFLAFKSTQSPINPVPAILAETYRAFTRHHEFRKDKMYFSFPVLYVWLISHVGVNKSEVGDLLSDAMGCNPKIMNSHEWKNVLKNLDGVQIRWFSQKCWKDKPSVIFRCGSFQNVPLMGTQGCINYNPSLTLRQLGYPMRDSPSEAMLSRLYLHVGIPKDEGLLRRVLQAWETVVRKDKDELSKRTTAVSFTQWLEKRIKETRSPIQKALSIGEKKSELHIPITEELEETKIALSKAEEEKKALKDRLGVLMQDKRKLENENALQAAVIEETGRTLAKEEESKKEMQKHLKGAREEVRRCTYKMNEAVAKANEWKKQCAKSKEESRKMKFELESQVESIRQDRESIIRTLRDYQRALEQEQGKSESLAHHMQYWEESYLRLKEKSNHWESRFVELLDKVKSQEVYEELKREGLYWRNKFSDLAWLANQAVRDIPRKLRRADAEMNPFNTPAKVCEFVEYCKIMTEELMEKAKDAAESKKRRREEKLKAICL